ncbi:hypothetical protein NDU88_001176 [Pleurodeles waltl]|uniref:Uncharacterized protein n=1 Tax=Pleurodeles waltl TaxID=8319 RepID=A0AAV7UTC1_PLEWA|nr:hypothetical protein NDU88_001176 [Pleurodeles waltl]
MRWSDVPSGRARDELVGCALRRSPREWLNVPWDEARDEMVGYGWRCPVMEPGKSWLAVPWDEAHMEQCWLRSWEPVVGLLAMPSDGARGGLVGGALRMGFVMGWLGCSADEGRDVHVWSL